MKERLFELIREGKILLFAGAGTSIEAGYPNGDKLRDTLYRSLKPNEKREMDSYKNLPLPMFADEFCKFKNDNRKILNRILLNQFVYTEPISLKWHKELSNIAHIKTIITTNYDTLFEKGYGNKCSCFFNSTHVSNNRNCQTEIYKIHGDLSDLETVILTTSDYRRLIGNHFETSVFWSIVKAKMAVNNILFIGYSLEDLNVNAILERIIDDLGPDNQKEHFFLSPNLPNHRQQDLKKKGIHFIQMDAARFLIELKKNVEEYVAEDFQLEKINHDILFKYSENHGVFPILSGDGARKVIDFRGVNGQPVKRDIQLEIANNWRLEDELSKYISGKNFDNFEIPGEKILRSTLRCNNIVLAKNNLSKILFAPVPEIQTDVDIVFENGVEYTNIAVKLYKRSNYAEIRAKLTYSEVTLKFDLSNEDREVQFKYEHHELCGKLKDEIAEMEIFKLLGEGKALTIYPKGHKQISDQLPQNKSLVEVAEFELQYLKNLEIIENLYNIRFEAIPFESINEINSHSLTLLLNSKENKTVEVFWDGEMRVNVVEAEKIIPNARKMLLSDNYESIYPSDEQDKLTLYNHKFILGYRLTKIVEPYLQNRIEIEKGLNDVAIYKSKVKKILVRWTEELLVSGE